MMHIMCHVYLLACVEVEVFTHGFYCFALFVMVSDKLFNTFVL